MTSSIAFYDANATELAAKFLSRDLSSVYSRFCPLLSKGTHILDAGCGPGRDARYFIDQGYSVTAFDLSEEMVKVASEHLGQTVLKQSFQDMNYKECFDGIWAHTSLLHVPKSEISEIFKKFIKALRYGGVWMMSFKHGETERIYSDHITNDYTQESLKLVIQEFPELELIDIWQEQGSKPKHEGESLVLAIVRRVNYEKSKEKMGSDLTLMNFDKNDPIL